MMLACSMSVHGEAHNMVVWIPKRVSSTGGAASPNYAAFLNLTKPTDSSLRRCSQGSTAVRYEQEYVKALRSDTTPGSLMSEG